MVEYLIRCRDVSFIYVYPSNIIDSRFQVFGISMMYGFVVVVLARLWVIHREFVWDWFEIQQNTRKFGIVTYIHDGTRAERWQS